MKIIVQIPCLNEEETLETAIRDIPDKIAGADELEIIVIDDGSTDNTYETAKKISRVSRVIRMPVHQGLPAAFMKGVNAALESGADIIVNTDGDNQYYGRDIEKLIKPIIDGEADVVIGDRQVETISHFSMLKKFLQKSGSAIVRHLSKSGVYDATSGFRAFSRESAMRLKVFSKYSYTLETIIQLASADFKIVSVYVKTNPKLRESHLIKSIPEYLYKSGKTIVMLFFIYNPLKLFMPLCLLFGVSGAVLVLRFFYFYFFALGATGHVQSFVFGLALSGISFMFCLTGGIASLIAANRRILEDIDYETKKMKYEKRLKFK